MGANEGAGFIQGYTPAKRGLLGDFGGLCPTPASGATGTLKINRERSMTS
jgi:hypothetical protein